MKAGRGFLALFAVLAAGALGVPLAHAGSYDVLSCTIDGGYHANSVALAGGNAFSPGTFAALYFNAPSNTTITDSAGGRFTFRMRLRPNDSYPYARGTSKARRVRVG